MFTQDDIRMEATYGHTFQKGLTLYNKGNVLSIDTQPDYEDGFYIDGTVLGSYENIKYNTWIHVDESTDSIDDYECDCPAFSSYHGMCKHCVALALEFLAHKNIFYPGDSLSYFAPAQYITPTTDSNILEIVKDFAFRKHLQEQTPCGNITLVPELHESYSYFWNGPHYSLTFKIGSTEGRLYVLKNISTFIEHVWKEEMYSYGKQLAFVHSKCIFTEKSWKYVKMMKYAYELTALNYQAPTKELILTPTLWDIFYKINKGDCVNFQSDRSKDTTVQFMETEPPVKLLLEQHDQGGFQLQIPALQVLYGEKTQYVKIKNKIYPCSSELTATLGCFLDLANNNSLQSYYIAEKDMPAFCGSVLPELERVHALDIKNLDLEPFQPKEVKIEYYLDEEYGRVTLRIKGIYGETTYNLLTPPSFSNEYHDRTKELRALNVSRAYFSEEDTAQKLLYFSSDDYDKMYHLLSTGIEQLEKEGTVYATDRIKGKKLIQSTKTHVGVSVKSGLLELSVQSDTFSSDELAGILDSYRKKKKYYRLKSGNYVGIEDNALSTIAELLDGLSISSKDLENGQVDVPLFRACYIDQVLHEKDADIQMKRDVNYKAMIRDMKNVEDSDFSIPESLSDVLRNYQKIGFRWLNTLAKLGFGGILADDMGLGKTLQIITFLLYRMQVGASTLPSLIICPASLVYNWEHEIKHFAPELSVKIIIGNATQREQLIKEENHSDVWITSYDMIKRDISLYKNCPFDTEIIDEAQTIKNHGTQAAKSVKKVQSRIRFALTGTPIENRLSELWSIFDFLMPGILGTYEKFRKEYELPIVQNQDQVLTERLKKMISPFILRRLKSEVLKELPEKLEQIVYTEMETEQRKIYEAHTLQLMEQLQRQSQEDVQKGKLQILAELTRLRQVCCAPEMLYENYNAISCKIDACLELINQAIEGNHKVLIFSQFTSIFPILERHLKQAKINYYELTGQTSKEERIQLVNQFNQNDVPVFLISLKAGGTGLNLTAASIVIHFDPWWNLAAQNQATDRAHRIGQEKQVVVFKLIAQNTIEEKIIDLQTKKQHLADQILNGESVSMSSLSKDDFMEILKF